MEPVCIDAKLIGQVAQVSVEDTTAQQRISVVGVAECVTFHVDSVWLSINCVMAESVAAIDGRQESIAVSHQSADKIKLVEGTNKRQLAIGSDMSVVEEGGAELFQKLTTGVVGQNIQSDAVSLGRNPSSDLGLAGCDRVI